MAEDKSPPPEGDGSSTTREVQMRARSDKVRELRRAIAEAEGKHGVPTTGRRRRPVVQQYVARERDTVAELDREKTPGATVASGDSGSSTPPLSSAGALGGSGGDSDSGSRIVRRSGRRPMKEYPLSEGELNELAGLGLLATICFSICSACISFAIDVTANFAFSTEVPPSISGFWHGLRDAAWLVAALTGAAGIAFVLRGNTRVQQIKDETDHGAG